MSVQLIFNEKGNCTYIDELTKKDRKIAGRDSQFNASVMLRYWTRGQFDILLMTFTILLLNNLHTVNSYSDLTRSICSSYTIMGCVITQDFLFCQQIQIGPVVEGVNTIVGDLQELSKGLENCTLPVAAECINEAWQNGTLQPLRQLRCFQLTDTFDVFHSIFF